MKDFKIRVGKPESLYVQQKCMDAGIFWAYGDNKVDYNIDNSVHYLFVDRTIGFSSSKSLFNESDLKEITFASFVEMINVMEEKNYIPDIDGYRLELITQDSGVLRADDILIDLLFRRVDFAGFLMEQHADYDYDNSDISNNLRFVDREEIKFAKWAVFKD